MKNRRNTTQQRRILETLQGLTSHPTAAELFEQVRRVLPRVSLGTVYRNLEVLHEEGLIRKLAAPGGEQRFDADLEDHYHVRCTACGLIGDLEAALLAEPVAPPAEAGGFAIHGFRLEFRGLCPACRHAEAKVRDDEPAVAG